MISYKTSDNNRDSISSRVDGTKKNIKKHLFSKALFDYNMDVEMTQKYAN